MKPTSLNETSGPVGGQSKKAKGSIDSEIGYGSLIYGIDASSSMLGI